MTLTKSTTKAIWLWQLLSNVEFTQSVPMPATTILVDEKVLLPWQKIPSFMLIANTLLFAITSFREHLEFQTLILNPWVPSARSPLSGHAGPTSKEIKGNDAKMRSMRFHHWNSKRSGLRMHVEIFGKFDRRNINIIMFKVALTMAESKIFRGGPHFSTRLHAEKTVSLDEILARGGVLVPLMVCKIWDMSDAQSVPRRALNSVQAEWQTPRVLLTKSTIKAKIPSKSKFPLYCPF